MPIDREALREELIEHTLNLVRDPETKETARVAGLRLAADMLGVVSQRQKSVDFNNDSGEEEEAPPSQEDQKSLEALGAELKDLKAQLADLDAQESLGDPEAARGPIEERHREKLEGARKQSAKALRERKEAKKGPAKKPTRTPAAPPEDKA